MKHYYNKKTNSFYIDEINKDIPSDSVEITEEQHNELYNAINAGCIIFDDLTFSEPPTSSFHKWNEKTKKWVKDKDAENEATIVQNQAMKNLLINEANDKIAVLQDSIDLNMQEQNADEKLKQWKRYRILLTRVDTLDIDVVFPQKPI